MSRAETVMDGVLTHLADGIFTSATQLRGYLPHDVIEQAASLPHVQAYSPITTSSADAYRDAPTQLEFSLELLDVPGREDVLRAALETLSNELHHDTAFANSMGAQRIQVELRDVHERTERETSIAGARITVDFPDPGTRPGDVDVFPLAGNDSLVVSTGLVEIITDSAIIQGGIGFRKIANIDIGKAVFSGFAVYPLDLTVTKTLRWLSYNRTTNTTDHGGMSHQSVRLKDSGGVVQYYNLVEGPAGWTEFAIDIANPTGGGPIDLSDVVSIEWWRFFDDATFTHDAEATIIKRIYYRSSDTVTPPTAVPSSLTVEAMQFALDKLQSSGYGATRQRGYLPPDQIQQAATLPFVQVWQAETETTEGPYGARPSSLSFNLQIIDVPANADSVRDALETLASDLRDDPSDLRTFRVLRHGVDERTTERETAIGTAEIRVEWHDPDERTGDVDVLDLDGNASSCTSELSREIVTDSALIAGGIGLQRNGGDLNAIVDFDGVAFDFPIDLSSSVTSKLRLLVYNRENSSDLVRHSIRLYGGGVSNTYTSSDVAVGWVELVADLANPTSGGGADLGAVTHIKYRKQWDNTAAHADVAQIVKRIYYRSSDTVSAITPINVSRDADAMQAVLDHLADVVIGGTPTKLRGFRGPDTISEGLPFIQVHSGQSGTGDASYRTTPDALVFRVDVIDANGRADVLRNSFQELAANLRAAPGLVAGGRRVRVSRQLVADRAEDETTIGSCEVRVDWNDSDSDPSITHVLDLAGNASLCNSGAGTDTITDSSIIDGGIAWAKNTLFFLSIMIFGPGFPEYPLDISDSITSRLRITLYNRANNVTDSVPPGSVTWVVLVKDGSAITNNYQAAAESTTGWHEINCDLANPTVDGGCDLSDVESISIFSVTNTSTIHDDEAYIVTRIYYTDRDTGSLAHDRTF